MATLVTSSLSIRTGHVTYFMKFDRLSYHFPCLEGINSYKSIARLKEVNHIDRILSPRVVFH